MRSAQDSFLAAAPEAGESLDALYSGYSNLVKALGDSDSASAAQTRLADLEKKKQEILDAIHAENVMMFEAPKNVDKAKQDIIAKANEADKAAKAGFLGFIGKYAPSLAESQRKEAAEKFENEAKPIHNSYVTSNQGLLRLPDGGSSGAAKTEVDYSGASNFAGGGAPPGPAKTLQDYQSGSGFNKTSGGPGKTQQDYQSASALNETSGGKATSQNDYQQAGQGSGGSGSGGSGSGASGGSGGSGSAGSGGASTGVQSGAAVAERGAPAAAPSQGASQAGGAGGGVGAPPAISGVVGGPVGGGGGQPARVGGIGVGGSEAPRTGVQGGGAAEKPAAASSSSGSGAQQSGLSRGGGAGGVGGETRAMSAQQAALRDALRTGDTAAGAGAFADKAAASQQVLGTGLVSGLHGPSLSALTTRTQAAAGAWEALPDRFSARSPVLGVDEAQVLFGGGTLTGAGMRGFDDKLVFRRLPLPDLGGYAGASFLLFVYEDYSMSPNPDAGVFRPVFSEVTSTEANGSLRPGFEVPEGVGVMDRSHKALSVASDAEADPGKLALYLAKWRLGLFESHATSWRPVAVGFLADPGEGSVAGLAQLGVEAYWPGRDCYTMVSPSAEDTLTAGTDQVGAASSRADREVRARFDEKSGKFGVPPGTDPDAPFDGRCLSGKDKASHGHFQRELGRSPTAREYVEDRLARKRRPDGAIDDSFSF